jgi:hypothetical protein
MLSLREYVAPASTDLERDARTRPLVVVENFIMVRELYRAGVWCGCNVCPSIVFMRLGFDEGHRYGDDEKVPQRFRVRCTIRCGALRFPSEPE